MVNCVRNGCERFGFRFRIFHLIAPELKICEHIECAAILPPFCIADLWTKRKFIGINVHKFGKSTEAFIHKIRMRTGARERAGRASCEYLALQFIGLANTFALTSKHPHLRPSVRERMRYFHHRRLRSD